MSNKPDILKIKEFSEYVNSNDGLVEVFEDSNPKHIEIMFNDPTGESDIESYCYHVRFFNQNTEESVFLSHEIDSGYLREFESPKEVVDVLSEQVIKPILCVFDMKEYLDVESICSKTVN